MESMDQTIRRLVAERDHAWKKVAEERAAREAAERERDDFYRRAHEYQDAKHAARAERDAARRELADLRSYFGKRLIASLPASPPPPVPTHRCKTCGCLWVLRPRGTVPGLDDASWSLAPGAKPGTCCDVGPMSRDQVEPLAPPVPAEASPEVPRDVIRVDEYGARFRVVGRHDGRVVLCRLRKDGTLTEFGNPYCWEPDASFSADYSPVLEAPASSAKSSASPACPTCKSTDGIPEGATLRCSDCPASPSPSPAPARGFWLISETALRKVRDEIGEPDFDLNAIEAVILALQAIGFADLLTVPQTYEVCHAPVLIGNPLTSFVAKCGHLRPCATHPAQEGTAPAPTQGEARPDECGTRVYAEVGGVPGSFPCYRKKPCPDHPAVAEERTQAPQTPLEPVPPSWEETLAAIVPHDNRGVLIGRDEHLWTAALTGEDEKPYSSYVCGVNPLRAVWRLMQGVCLVDGCGRFKPCPDHAARKQGDAAPEAPREKGGG